MITLATDKFTASAREGRILATFLRKGTLVLPHGTRCTAGPLLPEVLHSQVTLESLGYCYSLAVIRALSWLSHAELSNVHYNIEHMLKIDVGAHQLFSPMYPNFPEQVLQAPEAELLSNAWAHYLGDWLGLRVLPLYAKSNRPILDVTAERKPTSLMLAQPGELQKYLLIQLNGNASLAETEKEVLLDLLSYFNDHYPNKLAHLLSENLTLPQKEIRALVGAWLLHNAPLTFSSVDFSRFYTTPTDVLRFASAVGQSAVIDLKTADLTLTTPLPFDVNTRNTRRLFLKLIDNLNNTTALSEMFQHREQWIRFGEKLHPGEYKKRFPNAFELFKALRNNQKPTTWQGTVATLMKSDPYAAAKLLAARPGVFARMLHEIVRKSSPAHRIDIITLFASVANQVSTPVLLQLRHRMKADLAKIDVQAFLPKSGLSRMWIPQEPPIHLDVSDANLIVATITDTLATRFASGSTWGNVYIDPALHGYSVPFAQRTAQKALRTLGRGSRVPLNNKTAIVRAFLWWNETGNTKTGHTYSVGRTDLDLSCIAFDSTYNYISHCSFTQLVSAGLTHSGDITSAPRGACEFIDIDFNNLPDNTAYITVFVYSYTKQNFAELPEAYMGWMERTHAQHGEIFDARTVRQKVDLTASGQRVLIGCIDVARREFVWADLVLPAESGFANVIESSSNMTSMLTKGILADIRPTLFDLILDHASVRGTLVDTPENADMLFLQDSPSPEVSHTSNQSVITPFNTEFLKTLLAN